MDDLPPCVMIIRVTPHKDDCERELFRMMSPEVVSLAYTATTGKGITTDQLFSGSACSKYARAYEQITGVHPRYHDELREAYEKTLGCTYEELLKRKLGYVDEE